MNSFKTTQGDQNKFYLTYVHEQLGAFGLFLLGMSQVEGSIIRARQSSGKDAKYIIAVENHFQLMSPVWD